MNVEYQEFIGLYRNVYASGYCQHLINEFERLVDSGAGSSRISEGSLRHSKDDFNLFLNIRAHSLLNFSGYDTVSTFFDGLQNCYENYSEKFSVLKECKIRATHMKMQRTSPGQGYHIWHGEATNKINSDRILVYILYLNSLTPQEAGETEFLYQQSRIKPEENMMVIWPAGFEHAHRGNVVHGQNNKYIVTGWFYYD